jgi:arginase
MRSPVGVLGVPTSAGAFAPGQEWAPSALRDAGLLDALRERGADVQDHGDREHWRWRPDRERPRAQNVAKVVEIVRDTASRVRVAATAGELTVVLGGDCTVGIGTVAGWVQTEERIGLLYFDAHADLNVPSSVPEGALDWMGMAHMLAQPEALPELAAAFPHTPLLDPADVILFGWDPGQATDYEREVIARRGITRVPVAEVAADPEGTATEAVTALAERCDRLLVHFDVDVIDFTDMPLSENTGRNEGLPYAAAMEALVGLLSSPKLAALTITELNPDHVESPAALTRFVEAVAAALVPSGP